MKKIMMSVLVLAGLAQTLPAHALVAIVERCTTSDGQYTMSIANDEGIGWPRIAHFYANIENAAGDVVAEYAVTYDNPQIRSVSFGHSSYLDSASNGKDFDFALPSTNTPYALTATLKDGQVIRYGLRFDPSQDQGSLSCN